MKPPAVEAPAKPAVVSAPALPMVSQLVRELMQSEAQLLGFTRFRPVNMYVKLCKYD